MPRQPQRQASQCCSSACSASQNPPPHPTPPSDLPGTPSGEIVVRDLLLGFQQAPRGDPLDLAGGDVGVVVCTQEGEAV